MAPPALLFEWALPLLPTGSRDAATPRQGTRGALLALGAAMAHADDILVSRRGASVVQALLASLEHSLPALVSCTLWALQRIVAVHPELLIPPFRDVVDLVLGWTLDPSLPVEARHAVQHRSTCNHCISCTLSRSLAVALLQGMSDGWAANPQLPQQLLDTLLHDVQAASDASSATRLGMAACVTVVLQAVGAHVHSPAVQGVGGDHCLFELLDKTTT